MHGSFFILVPLLSTYPIASPLRREIGLWDRDSIGFQLTHEQLAPFLYYVRSQPTFKGSCTVSEKECW